MGSRRCLFLRQICSPIKRDVVTLLKNLGVQVGGEQFGCFWGKNINKLQLYIGGGECGVSRGSACPEANEEGVEYSINIYLAVREVQHRQDGVAHEQTQRAPAPVHDWYVVTPRQEKK